MNFIENIVIAWRRLGLVQKAMLMAIVMACGITGLFVTKWASTPDMRPLFTGLSPEDAGNISDKLSEKGVPFEMKGSGSIYVPKEQVHQLRADLAKDGLPGTGSDGYSLFDKDGFAQSPMQMDINLTRALQDEIAKSINMFECVMSSKVQIVRPKKNVFDSKSVNSKASVMLMLKPGFVPSQMTVAAMANMVAGSVEGLSTENVVIVDSSGRMLSNGTKTGKSKMANTFMDYKDRVERELAERAQRMLETLLGPNRSSVVVSVELDMDSEDKLVTTYEKGTPKRETIVESSKVTAGAVDEEGNPLGGGDEESEQEIETEMAVPETTVKMTKAAGKILSASVAAVVDLTAPEPEPELDENGQPIEKPSDSQPKKIVSVDQVKNLIYSAVGRNILKEENLEVVDAPFNRPKMPEVVEDPWYITYLGLIKQGSLAIMALCALLSLKIFSGKITAVNNSRSAQLASGENSAKAALQSGDTREKIAMAFRNDPEQVKELFTSWIEEKG